MVQKGELVATKNERQQIRRKCGCSRRRPVASSVTISVGGSKLEKEIGNEVEYVKDYMVFGFETIRNSENLSMRTSMHAESDYVDDRNMSSR
jgi:hypothetical protein